MNNNICSVKLWSEPISLDISTRYDDKSDIINFPRMQALKTVAAGYSLLSGAALTF
jgi:hypothetical protein